MALSGVNKLCRSCSKGCKQWKQIKLVRCPSYQRKQDAKFEGLQISSTAE